MLWALEVCRTSSEYCLDMGSDIKSVEPSGYEKHCYLTFRVLTITSQYLLRLSASPTVLLQGLHDFPQSLQTNFRITP
jgi:hypothetical protein